MIIYKITNKINGKLYIGQTTRTIERRFRDHCTSSKSAISLAISKYGKENFNIEVIYEASSLEELNIKEIEFIKQFNSISPNGYNLREGGDNSSFGEETRKRMSESAKRKPKMTEDTKRKISESRKGEKHYLYKKKLSVKQRKILSDHAKLRTGDKNPMFNKNHTVEVKEAQSQRARGSKNGVSKLNEEQVLKIREDWNSKLKTAKELGVEYGVSHRTIEGIVYGRSWKHLIKN